MGTPLCPYCIAFCKALAVNVPGTPHGLTHISDSQGQIEVLVLDDNYFQTFYDVLCPFGSVRPEWRIGCIVLDRSPEWR